MRPSTLIILAVAAVAIVWLLARRDEGSGTGEIFHSPNYSSKK